MEINCCPSKARLIFMKKLNICMVSPLELFLRDTLSFISETLRLEPVSLCLPHDPLHLELRLYETKPTRTNPYCSSRLIHIPMSGSESLNFDFFRHLSATDFRHRPSKRLRRKGQQLLKGEDTKRERGNIKKGVACPS